MGSGLALWMLVLLLLFSFLGRAAGGGGDVDAAKLRRQQELHVLFTRYGDNSSLTVQGFRRLLHSIGLGQVKWLPGGEEEEEEEAAWHRGEHHAAHGSGCLVPAAHRSLALAAPATSEPLTNNTQPKAAASAETKECLNASGLLHSHGMEQHKHMTTLDFGYICPAIVNQIDSKFCLVHATEEIIAEGPQKVYSVHIAWIGGVIAISIISFLSLLGIIFVRLMNRVFFKFLQSFLVALAVGALSGDAFLHLLPHSHARNHHHHDAALFAKEDGTKVGFHFMGGHKGGPLDATWKGLTALGGLYFMFLVEHLITLVKQYKDKKQKHQKKTENEDDLEIKKQLSNFDLRPSSNEDKSDSDATVHVESLLRPESQSKSQSTPTPVDEEEEEVMIAHSHPEESYNEYLPRGCENKCHSHLHDTLGQSDDLIHHHHDYHHILHHHHHQNHHPHSHTQRYSREELKEAGIATLAWMVIVGDGLHNLSDGLAIGAAFTEGLSSGLSTSLAVFFHELPHELGDFAVLLNAGMTVKQAFFYNLLSAMLAYFGMVTGILVGHYAENVTLWIFALTAGLFMYVALVDMMPEMLHNDASDHGCSRWGYFLLQNAGILLGFGVILLISVFEYRIVFNINL
ncbi:zinc transporter ZIP6 [Microcaecilia unicolor]|uniref:Zinc transporter ZIP6 n=1 Tax=Microcaecilia unicolor TaxID=1415580 RepID=A0A6P7YCG1_9AMPH|nr:zinc transporter ZIP6 [Microcaecilia unicolor]